MLRRIGFGWPFAILIGEVRRPDRPSERVPAESPSDDLQKAVRDAASCLPSGYPLARAGRSRIAVVIPEGTATSSLEVSSELSDQLEQRGWWAAYTHASYPENGTEMMPLLQTAIERLHHVVGSSRLR